MDLTIKIPESLEEKLKSAAQEEGLSEADYVNRLLQRDLEFYTPTAPEDKLRDENDKRPIWEVIEDIVAEIPPEDFEKVPVDGASQVDHYLYGHKKR